MISEMQSDLTIEELLQEHQDWHYNRTDRNGTRYFFDYSCPRCGGTGRIDYYNYIDKGVCFKCGGTGYLDDHPTTIKVYTTQHYDKLMAARADKHAQKAEARRLQILKNEGFAFNEETQTWGIYRVVGNTFEIKDTLKELGCHYRPALGWYSSHELDDYCTQYLTIDDLFSNKELLVWKTINEIKELWLENQSEAVESTSEWQGAPGQAITVHVYVKDQISGSVLGWGYFGKDSHLYKMIDDNGNEFTWATGKSLPLHEYVTLRGTVKAHLLFHDIKQTALTRCKVIEEN